MAKPSRTLVLLKPDALQRGLAGTLIARMEQRGLKIIGMKLVQIDRALAARHYTAHVGKPFYPGLVEFITASPVIAIALQGENAVDAARQLMGATDPLKAAPGTVRGDFGLAIGRNLIHGSDSPEAAERELALYFKPEELVDWPRDTERWITES
ncbi:MAG: nucleoside-diphosphate kinase [Dehalococcoidia bacterium]|nr:nucleoside-diphosphate kinase [Dehalococcoidia bacterium]